MAPAEGWHRGPGCMNALKGSHEYIYTCVSENGLKNNSWHQVMWWGYHSRSIRKASKKSTGTSVVEDVEILEPPHAAGGTAKWCSRCEKVWWFLKNTKCRIIIRSSNSTPRYVPKRTEKRSSNRNSTLCSQQHYHKREMETTQVPIRAWMEKPGVPYPHRRGTFGNKKEGNSDTGNLDGLLLKPSC